MGNNRNLMKKKNTKIKKIFEAALVLTFILILCGCKSVDTESANSENVDTESANSEGDNLLIKDEAISVSGINENHSFYFIADSHISKCDERDKELMEKAGLRASAFKHGNKESWETFSSLIDRTISKKGETVILGGDIVDSAMYASIDFVKEQLDRLNGEYLYFMGNHDFEYGNEYFSDKAYTEYLPRLSHIHSCKPYEIRDMGEYIIFAVSDHNSQIDGDSLNALKELMEQKKPVVLALHVPIEPYTGDNSLTEACIEKWGENGNGGSKVTMGVNGCYPNEVTKEFIDLTLSEDSPVVLVLAGHIHFYHKDMLNDRVVQIATGAAFEGEALYITLKAE